MVHASHELRHLPLKAFHFEAVRALISDILLVEDKGITTFIECHHKVKKTANRENIALYTAQLFVTQFNRSESEVRHYSHISDLHIEAEWYVKGFGSRELLGKVETS